MTAERQEQHLEQVARELGKYTKEERERGERRARKGVVDKHIKPYFHALKAPA